MRVAKVDREGVRCRYQSTLPLFLPASDLESPQAHSTALKTMTAALPVAAQSASSAPQGSGSQPRRARVALSLGPYGSSLSPGQEYTGAYPPPFGPSETAARDAKPGCSQQALEACPLPLEQISPAENHSATADDEAERYLAAWHLQRLQQFSSSAEWSSEIDILAFETVPSLAEIRAIRRAMHAFTASRDGAAAVPFYISLVFPRTSDSDSAVRFPDPALAHLVTLQDQMPLLVQTALGSLGSDYARPGGLGFNCTSPLHAKRVVGLLSRHVRDQLAQSGSGSDDAAADAEKPWLFVYPDGGAVYDVVSRSWHHPTGLTDSSWAALVADAVADAVPPVPAALAQGEATGTPWAGVVVGGCCKAGPSAIKALRQEVEKRQWR